MKRSPENLALLALLVRRALAAAALTGLSLLAHSPARAGDPPDTAIEAVAEFDQRRNNMIRRTIVRLLLIEPWEGDLKAHDWGKEAEKPRQKARSRVAMADAVLWVLSHPSDFATTPADAYPILQRLAIENDMARSWDPEKYLQTWRYWIGDEESPGQLWTLFDQLTYFSEDKCKVTEKVGTNCDYDFILVELAHLLYTYRDGDAPLSDPLFDSGTNTNAVPYPGHRAWTYADFLKNGMIFNIVCQRQKTSVEGVTTRACGLPGGQVPYAFGALDDDRLYKQYACGPQGVLCATTAETENHVLNIVAWDYLTTNWVMWQGSLKQGRRRSEPMRQVWEANKLRWKGRHETVYERALAVTGRVMHSGMYEANSRPYGRVSLSALLALANHADPPMGSSHGPVQFDSEPSYVKRGANNAVDYLATKYAFQALRGKRQGPMRRSKEYKAAIDFYGHNEFVTMMSLLSGSHEWDDCINYGLRPGEDYRGIVVGADGVVQRPDCPILGWDTFAYVSTLTGMLSSSTGGYRIPPAIHEFMFHRGPFYARMKTRYTADHYPNMRKFPQYFSDKKRAFHTGTNKSSVELHFGDDNILLSAGGSYWPYYSVVNTNNFWSKPTMLIPRGDFGHEFIDEKIEFFDGMPLPVPVDLSLLKPGDWQWKSGTLEGVIEDVMVSPGKVRHWYESECNTWQYRNFVYGYRFHDRGTTDADLATPSFSKQYPFYVPDFWASAADRVVDFTIGAARFEIYEFSSPRALVPPSSEDQGLAIKGDGYFIVRAKFRKKAASSSLRHREFSRGFLEIIPRSYIGSGGVEALRAEIEAENKAGYFDREDRLESWKYVLTLSKERVHMGSEMGANNVGGEACDDGILGIYEKDGDGKYTVAVDMEEQFIPSDIRNSPAMKRIPLITVWALDDLYEPTECKLVETPREGSIIVRQPDMKFCLAVDAEGRCRRWWKGSSCLVLDSSAWQFPTSTTLAAGEPGCDCFGQPN